MLTSEILRFAQDDSAVDVRIRRLVEAAGFSDAQDFADFAAFDDFAGGAALAVEPGHEVLQAHLVFFFRLENQNLNGTESIRRDTSTF